METVLRVLLVLISVAIVGLVMIQPSKSQGLAGLITGGSNENFFAKNKVKTKEKVMARITVVLSLAFVGIVIALNLI
ncbi:preprotein translocase subunit SecG [Oceanirhabdus seepicola]|uniref:Protein-export membrane protein SecG n=1 Tax=Oceanirhabdus seepicola TaxID=2828781 RepID=A0A9J6P2X9_9CLOT|nr:preprotein translocase subunit SecG [Oceanirhabdus seepicola]MCM1990425.1 preprotein translocase subunit SecG [Oceanirhabdus seepicola]